MQVENGGTKLRKSFGTLKVFNSKSSGIIQLIHPFCVNRTASEDLAPCAPVSRDQVLLPTKTT
jgi:hypothetical protein